MKRHEYTICPIHDMPHRVGRDCGPCARDEASEALRHLGKVLLEPVERLAAWLSRRLEHRK